MGRRFVERASQKTYLAKLASISRGIDTENSIFQIQDFGFQID